MRLLKIILLLSYFISLSACVSTGSFYHEPSRTLPHATIRGEKPPFLFLKGKSIYIAKIDGQQRGMILSSNSKIRLAPGPHSIEAGMILRKHFFSEGNSASAKLYFNAKQSKDYKIAAKMHNNKMVFWIIDNHEQPVSKKVAVETLPEGAHKVKVAELPRF